MNIISLSSPPTENAWAFAKWNAIQAVGVMSFGEFVSLILMMELPAIFLVIFYAVARQKRYTKIQADMAAKHIVMIENKLCK